jgi:hypothetical protein
MIFHFKEQKKISLWKEKFGVRHKYLRTLVQYSINPLMSKKRITDCIIPYALKTHSILKALLLFFDHKKRTVTITL